ncbi:MAG: N-acetylneuraminate synthase family protein, partial [Lentisphaerae bacterium]|nr:N-acetylneuraminate synthase family protein [Lentisphaerota bacterium]
MIIVLKSHCPDEEIRHVEDHVRELGYQPHTIRGVVRTVVAAVGDETVQQSLEILENLPCVDRVIPIQKRFKLVSREAQTQTTVVRAGNVEIGSGTFHVIAGPCSVEDRDTMIAAAKAVAAAGATLLRGGAFKPRTSPFSFQGLQKSGLELLSKVKEQFDIPVITEVVDPQDVSLVASYADILQVGSRNMQNFALLTNVGRSQSPVVLKRGFSCTITEWLTAADYLLAEGNQRVILCE